MIIRIIASIIAAALLSSTALADACIKADECKGRITLSSGKKLPYYRTFPISGLNTDITRAVIVIHGMNRNADDYFDYAVNATRLEERLDNTVVITPKFQTEEDGPSRNEHYWSRGGWKQGNLSQDSNRYSSFAAMDDIYRKLLTNKAFPNLEQIIIGGHSAGGQFVNRYAAGGQGCDQTSIHCKYMVMNPSSYLYIDKRRSTDNGAFEVPTNVEGFNDYKYGLDDLNSYMSNSYDKIFSNLFDRDTYYLAGTLDTASRNLDTRPPAMLQGSNRYNRWQIYQDYTKIFSNWIGSTFRSVQGVGHSAKNMFASDVARSVIFD